MKDDFKKCGLCFFSEKFPRIIIDEKGKCNFCKSNSFRINKKKVVTSDIKALFPIAEEIKKRKKGRYDCIIGASGGLDSSYVIYVAKKILGLNPLIVTYDHGFNYALAAENLKNICNNLGLDLRIVKSKEKHDLRFLRFMLQALSQIDIYYGLCFFCHYILPASVYKVAEEENISTLLTSSNTYEATLYLTRRFKIIYMLKAFIKLNPIKWAKFLIFLIIANYYLIRLKLEFYISPLVNIFLEHPKKPGNMRVVNISEYIDWDIMKMLKVLQEETGWSKPPGPRLPMRFDCMIEDSLLNYTYKKICGLTVHGIICNNLIYDNIYTREELKDAVKYYDDLIEISKTKLNGFKI